MKNLPIGLQDFSEIRKNNYLYVDKTKDICNFFSTGGKYFFLSRPRRFGKSLLVSTLKELFSGNQELFKGLYIYDKIEWKQYPVIHVDFTKIDYSLDNELKNGLTNLLDQINAKEDLHIKKDRGIKSYFSEILEKLYEKDKKQIVVLIDEYDKPIIDHITDGGMARKNREILREFFSVLKPSDPYLKFVFLTGVSKFSQVSIFSGLNNLRDITLSEQFVTILGITEKELTANFHEYIVHLSHKTTIAEDRLLKNIRQWYNGYSWDGKNRVYNPFSLLKLFIENTFNNYWFATGTPTFLINLLKEKKYNIPEIENAKASDILFNSYDIDNLEILSLLFQTGYITIKSIQKLRSEEPLYILDYPNFEVKESLLRNIIAVYTTIPLPKVKPIIEEMYESLQNHDMVKYITSMKSILAGIPYTLVQENESYYHTIFYIIANLLGAEVNLEVLTNQGRIDAVLELDDKIFIIEFKYRRENVDLDTLVKTALTQIRNKKYYEKYLSKNKRIYLLGIGFIEKEIGYAIEEISMR